MNAIDETQVQFEIHRRGTQTIYEMAFPLSVLRVEGKPGTRPGFSLLVNENDGEAREGYLGWSDGIGGGRDPEECGQLIYVRQSPMRPSGAAGASSRGGDSW